MYTCIYSPSRRRLHSRMNANIYASAEVFINELTNKVGNTIVTPKDSTPPAAASTPAAASSSADTETVQQQHDPVRQARKIGYEVDAYVSPKEGEGVWQITKITNENDVDLVQRVAGAMGAVGNLGAHWEILIVKRVSQSRFPAVRAAANRTHRGENRGTLKVTLATLIADWKPYKGKVQAVLALWDPAKRTQGPLQSTHWATEVARGAVSVALHQKTVEYDFMVADLELLQNPGAVKVTRAFKKGELKLVPSTTRVEKATAGVKALDLGDIDVDGHIVNLQLKQKFDPPLDAKGEKSKQPWVVPFWLVTPAGDEEGNMIMTYETCKVAAGFHINVPIMTNSVKLAAGALLIFGAATAKAEAASKKRKTAP